jgi:hypothetical protein
MRLAVRSKSRGYCLRIAEINALLADVVHQPKDFHAVSLEFQIAISERLLGIDLESYVTETRRAPRRQVIGSVTFARERARIAGLHEVDRVSAMLETEKDAAVLRIFLAQVESQDSAIECPRALDVRDVQQNMADSFERHRTNAGCPFNSLVNRVTALKHLNNPIDYLAAARCAEATSIEAAPGHGCCAISNTTPSGPRNLTSK